MTGMILQGSMVALVTPFRNDAVDEDALKRLIEWQIAEGTHGIVPVGTTGESPTLSHAEHERVIELTVQTVAGRVPVIAGTGSNNTTEALRFTRHAAEAGADAALVVTPYYNKPTQRGLLAHYRALHDGAEIPIVIYNIPGRSIIDMSPATMGELAKLPRIVGVKDATADLSRIIDQTRACGRDFRQISGEDATAVGYNAMGGVGCISVTANVAPRLCAQMQTACLDGDYSTAREIQDRLAPLHRALFLESSPAPAKYALSVLGHCEATVRAPLAGITGETQAAVRAAMVHAGLIND